MATTTNDVLKAKATTLSRELLLGAYRTMFTSRRVGLLHGRMTSDEKDHTMKAFAAGAIDVLVATTVIEVGIDVPNATVMVIEQA